MPWEDFKRFTNDAEVYVGYAKEGEYPPSNESPTGFCTATPLMDCCCDTWKYWCMCQGLGTVCLLCDGSRYDKQKAEMSAVNDHVNAGTYMDAPPAAPTMGNTTAVAEVVTV